jgi:hypothetical protein
MDRRLYRVDQFYFWASRNAKQELKAALENYRSAILDWNDNINRHLSMLQIFFGKEIREKFDFEVGRKFVTVGALVEQSYRSARSGCSRRLASSNGCCRPNRRTPEY